MNEGVDWINEISIAKFNKISDPYNFINMVF